MRFFFLVLLGSAAVVTAACGGKVVVDGNPDKTGVVGGATSASASSGVGGTTSTSPSSGSGPSDPLCLELCQAVLATGCAGDDCLVRCEGTLAAAPQCLEAAKAAALCIEDHAAGAPGCAVLPCTDAMTAYETCTSASLCEKAVVGATGTTPGCVGKGVCGGGDEWVATCDDTGLCECAVNNAVAGTCQETGPFLCDFLRGCCGKFFPPGE